jgi:hypothetical protein
VSHALKLVLDEPEIFLNSSRQSPDSFGEFLHFGRHFRLADRRVNIANSSEGFFQLMRHASVSKRITSALN